MSNKDIEEDVKELNRLYDIAEVVLPKYSTAKIVYRISEKQRIAIKNILADRQRYKNMYEAEHRIHLVRNEQLDRKEIAVQKANKYNALVENIKEKLAEENLPLAIVGGRRNGKVLNYGKKLGRKEILQDLLETIEGEKE